MISYKAIKSDEEVSVGVYIQRASLQTYADEGYTILRIEDGVETEVEDIDSEPVSSEPISPELIGDLIKIMLGIGEDSDSGDGMDSGPVLDGSSDTEATSSEDLIAKAKEFREKFKSYQESGE
jgi:hypothetical protein